MITIIMIVTEVQEGGKRAPASPTAKLLPRKWDCLEPMKSKPPKPTRAPDNQLRKMQD